MLWAAASDSLQDFSELRSLVEELSERLQFPGEPPPAPFLEKNREALVQELSDIGRAGETISLQLRLLMLGKCWERHGNWLVAGARKKRVQLKARLGACYRQAGTLFVASEPQSPVYDSSMPLVSFRQDIELCEHGWDYKRDRHLQARDFEREFVRQYFPDSETMGLEAYLFNSGMAAFSTVLHWLHGERGLSERVALLAPCYFENRHLVERFFGGAVIPLDIERYKGSDLEEAIRAVRPRVLFADAMVNTAAMSGLSLPSVLAVADQIGTAEAPVYLVLDTSCVPSCLYPNLVKLVDTKRVRIFFLESLAKYHQFGLDAVTGGIVCAALPEAEQQSFSKTRARFGGNITDSSVGALPSPNASLLLQRLARMSRNTRLFKTRLEEIACSPDSLLESVRHCEQDLQTKAAFSGTLLTLNFRAPYRQVAVYQRFEKLVIELARKAELLVRLSTSFGFDEMRLYVTAPATIYEPPFLRISIGTETEAEILELAEVFRAAEASLRAELPPLESITPELMAAPASLIRDGSVFRGENALADFLRPQNYAVPPLVELPAALNPFAADGVQIFAKLMYMVPLLNIKSLPAFMMLKEHAARGGLDGVKRVVESSSSNTVLSLSVIAKHFGIDNTAALVDHSLHPQLTKLLQLFGIEVLHHPGPTHAQFGKVETRSVRAAKLGERADTFNPNQYRNSDNPLAFAEWLAPQLWQQTEGKIDIVSFGLGACGTVSGTARVLRTLNPEFFSIGCCPRAGDAVPGPREVKLLADVAFPWRDACSAVCELPAAEGYEGSLNLLRSGIVAGPSSGLNYRGLLEVLGRLKSSGELDRIRARRGSVCSAFICCDSAFTHIDEYFEILGETSFPAVQSWEDVTSAST